ncbi:MAG: hypothetical protein EOP06_19225 [Proteobacteria bacterium]|nr:MAG: hypothetical protein EOP06_19225 [Pseudomonadota bacterium]
MKMNLNFKEGYMKNLMMFLFLISSNLMLVNCAKSSDSSNNNAAAVNVCGANMVQTQYGCLPLSLQGQCQQPGYAYAQQYGCVAPTTNYTNTCGVNMVQTQYGCLPASAGQCQVGYAYAQQYGGCVPPTTNYANNVCGVGMVQTQYGCQSQNGSYNGGVGSCGAGMVNTIQGCLAQNSCPQNFGYWYGNYQGVTQGWCYPARY